MRPVATAACDATGSRPTQREAFTADCGSLFAPAPEHDRPHTLPWLVRSERWRKELADWHSRCSGHVDAQLRWRILIAAGLVDPRGEYPAYSGSAPTTSPKRLFGVVHAASVGAADTVAVRTVTASAGATQQLSSGGVPATR
jgi:hypothetical protein